MEEEIMGSRVLRKNVANDTPNFENTDSALLSSKQKYLEKSISDDNKESKSVKVDKRGDGSASVANSGTLSEPVQSVKTGPSSLLNVLVNASILVSGPPDAVSERNRRKRSRSQRDSSLSPTPLVSAIVTDNNHNNEKQGLNIVPPILLDHDGAHNYDKGSSSTPVSANTVNGTPSGYYYPPHQLHYGSQPIPPPFQYGSQPIPTHPYSYPYHRHSYPQQSHMYPHPNFSNHPHHKHQHVPPYYPNVALNHWRPIHSTAPMRRASEDVYQNAKFFFGADNPGNAGLKEKKFVCPAEGCQKVFLKMSHLNRHSRVHAGVRPYRCAVPGCESTFVRRDNMLVHQRAHEARVKKQQEEEFKQRAVEYYMNAQKQQQNQDQPQAGTNHTIPPPPTKEVTNEMSLDQVKLDSTRVQQDSNGHGENNVE